MSDSEEGSSATASVSNAQAEPDSNKKRTGYLEWSEYFMGIALLSAQRSKDPSTQVGACIVNKEKRIVGIGYNGMPNGFDDDRMSWGKTGDWLDRKYPFVCHAELNAVLNKISASLKNCTIYVTLFPCNECAKVIIQSGIREVVYASDKKSTKKEYIASKQMFDEIDVKYTKFTKKRDTLVIDFNVVD